MNFIPVKTPDIIAKNVAGEMVLLIPASGRYFGLNAVGTRFWEMMDGQRTIQEIAAVIAEEYKVETSTVQADLYELAEKLSANQLISLNNPGQ